MKISEQIAELLKKRGEKVKAMEELNERIQKDARVFTAEESTAFDECVEEVKAFDTQVDKLKELEKIVQRQATPIVTESSRITGGNHTMPPGVGWTRLWKSMVFGQRFGMQALDYARTYYRDTPIIEDALRGHMAGIQMRAAANAATVMDSVWAGPLAAYQQLSGELIALIREKEILGRLTGVRHVPFRTKIAREITAIGTALWVGEGKPKPVGSGAFDTVTMEMYKLALIVVQTEELARSSDPNSEVLLRDGLVKNIVLQRDLKFLSADAVVAGVSPGGILNGIPGGQIFASSGNTAVDVNNDLTHAISLLNGGKGGENPAWIMNTITKTWLTGLQNGIGSGPQFPSVGANGTLMGYPIVDSTSQPAGAILLIDQPALLVAEDPNISIDLSREASLEMDTAPTDPATAALFSLWQRNCVGLRGEQFVAWLLARNTALVGITAVGYTTWPPAAPLAATASQSSVRSKPDAAK